jgi:hypothetical protein
MKNRLAGFLTVRVSNTDFVERCKVKARNRMSFFETAEFALVSIMNHASDIYGQDLAWSFEYMGDFSDEMKEFLSIVVDDGVLSPKLVNFLHGVCA